MIFLYKNLILILFLKKNIKKIKNKNLKKILKEILKEILKYIYLKKKNIKEKINIYI